MNKYFSIDEVAKVVCTATGKSYIHCLNIIQDMYSRGDIKGVLSPLPYDKMDGLNSMNNHLLNGLSFW